MAKLLEQVRQGYLLDFKLGFNKPNWVAWARYSGIGKTESHHDLRYIASNEDAHQRFFKQYEKILRVIHPKAIKDLYIKPRWQDFCTYIKTHLYREVLIVTSKCIWLQDSSSGALGNGKCIFIAITPRCTLIQGDSSCFRPIYGSNRTSVQSMTLNCPLIVKFQCWSFAECGVPLHYHYSRSTLTKSGEHSL